MDNINKIEKKRNLLMLKSIAVSMKSPVKNLSHYFTIGKKKTNYSNISTYFCLL